VDYVRYFILCTAVKEDDPFTDEFYIRGESIQQVFKQIDRYSNGLISTNLFGICTRNIKYGYIREVNINNYPELSSKDFAQICESKCISY
jgi:hypothetical protein